MEPQTPPHAIADARQPEPQVGRIRTLIVDDEHLARQRLRELLAEESDIEVIGECNHGGHAVQMITELKPDLVLLDVQMRGANGFEVLRRLSEGPPPLVVFVTAYEDYALNAFEVDAVDYLLKPFDRARFQQALTRVRQRLQYNDKARLRSELADVVRGALAHATPPASPGPLRRIVAERDERLTFIDPQDIDSVEANRNYIAIRVGREAYRLRSTLHQAEAMLDRACFLRIHRSVIVNTLKIRDMERWFHGEYVITLKNGQRFTSGRSYRRQIQAYLHNGVS
ncbi:MAG TPA: LytTR family DNA-binding domain-containing protein [Steroidobacteraceae bacterium]|nr:LytTR family DNA-binding domain-containing protein [Steroidobacteraceae bacterium]